MGFNQESIHNSRFVASSASLPRYNKPSYLIRPRLFRTSPRVELATYVDYLSVYEPPLDNEQGRCAADFILYDLRDVGSSNFSQLPSMFLSIRYIRPIILILSDTKLKCIIYMYIYIYYRILLNIICMLVNLCTINCRRYKSESFLLSIIDN